MRCGEGSRARCCGCQWAEAAGGAAPRGLRPALPVWGALWLFDFRVEPTWSVCPPGTRPRFSQVPKCTPGPLPWEEDSPDCADAALLGDCGVGAAFQRGGPSPEVCAGLHFHRPQSRAEQRVPFGTLKQHLLAQIHRSLFLKKKKPPETGSCSPQGALWNGARPLSSHQLLQTIN